MQNRIRYLLLLSTSVVFLLSAIPAAALFEGFEAIGVSQTEGSASNAVDFEIKTYQDIPYTGQLQVANGENELTFTIVEQPRKGTVILDGSTFTYTPKSRKTGKDTFTYAITNADGVTGAPATVSITIEKRRSQVTYSDMSGRSGYAAAVALAEEGIYVGRQIGQDWFFAPDEQVTRTEFLTMAMETVGVAVDPAVSMTGFLDDAAIPTWAKGYASAAVDEGIIRGISTEDGMVFRGESTITLQEAAVIMDRLLDVADVYLEDEQPAWADQALANMESVQVVAAGSFGSQLVDKPVTMVQAAEMLAATMEVLERREEGAAIFSWF